MNGTVRCGTNGASCKYVPLLVDLLSGRIGLFEQQLSDLLMTMASHHDMARDEAIMTTQEMVVTGTGLTCKEVNEIKATIEQ